jgi:2-methylcitrate dehydratase
LLTTRVTRVEELGNFVASRSFGDLSEKTVRQLKIRILDSLGCAIGALPGGPTQTLRRLTVELGGTPQSTLIGGGKTSPDRAALYNGALVRYLDYNDSFLAKGETCHPSDNFAPVLAASEYAGNSGKELLLSLAIAYEVQCKLSEIAPVRSKGFDHVTQGTYAVAAGASRALGLDARRTANAISIAGTSLNALRVSRTGKLSNWKGLAYPFMAGAAVLATFLARDGITGPPEVFEGNKGFIDAISGPFEIDWSKEGALDLVNRTILKKYNAEIHSQSAIECMLKLRDEGLRAQDVDSIEVKIFDVAYHIIGGGEEGEKKRIATKEEADHSLPYILAVALLDGKVSPEEYSLEKISSIDAQILLRKIHVLPDKDFSAMFPNAMPVEITVHKQDGSVVTGTTMDYDGFLTRPMTWDEAAVKFDSLATPVVEKDMAIGIRGIVADLENHETSDLSEQLQRIRMFDDS